MRPQQNRRMRGRGNNNRRGPNPLTRNYESNGPDVKIRGNAQHIADKYTTLARDAQASGDRIIAENYLQHAEHYIRIILSAHSQMSQPIIHDDIADDDMNDSNVANLTENRSEQPAGSGPQPVIEDTPTEIAFATNIGTTFDIDSDENPKTERLNKPTRRRLPRRTETTEAANATAVNGHTVKHGDSDSAANSSNPETEPGEKPRRGRRNVKAEKNEEVEQVDI